MSFVWLCRDRDLSIQLLSVGNYSLLRQSKARIESNLGHGPECCVAVEVHDVAPTLRHARHSQHNTLQSRSSHSFYRIFGGSCQCVVKLHNLQVLQEYKNITLWHAHDSQQNRLQSILPCYSVFCDPSLFFAVLLPNLITINTIFL